MTKDKTTAPHRYGYITNNDYIIAYDAGAIAHHLLVISKPPSLNSEDNIQ